MEIIGFIALLLIGGYFTFAGVASQMVTQGFAGKWSIEGFIFLIIGLVILYLAFINSPFKLITNV